MNVTSAFDSEVPKENNFNSSVSETFGNMPISTSGVHSVEKNAIHSFVVNSNRKYVLLSTALVKVKNIFGEFQICRAILDSASQSSFMTNDCATMLGLKRNKINIPVGGLNGNTVTVGQKVNTVISSRDNNHFMVNVDFLVVPRITDLTPCEQLDISNVQFPEGIILADSRFFVPSKVDIILGAELFFEILKPNQIRLSNQILLQNSQFGFIVTGSVSHNVNKTLCHLSIEDGQLDKTLRSFWEMESLHEEQPISSELKFCNEHFKSTHSRDISGRYIVQMPMVQDKHLELGESKSVAVKRLNSTINRFNKDPVLKQLYSNFMLEYEQLGHMEEIIDDVPTYPHYYIPHQAVLRPDKSTTKLRVVFDASCKSSNGVSLNDLLLKGGTVQDELWSILLRFRIHPIAFSADVQKMYRQIRIDSAQQDLLRIVWRNSVEEPLKEYRLKTVVYGTSPAPFLATRTLIQLADDEERNFPVAAPIVRKDFYVDDVLSGAPDLQTALEIQRQLIGMFKTAGMHLYKWCSNSPQLLSQVPAADQEYVFGKDETASVKMLGLSWNPKDDCFQFKTSNLELPLTFTKRTILSLIAKLYDPMGLLGPLIVKAKMFIQKLWLLGLTWDQELPDKEKKQFENFVLSLHCIESLKIPRCVISKETGSLDILGFADASEQAYGVCVYLRNRDNSHSASTHLLCSKSRISPLKTISIPRLELCACLLLSQLVDKIVSSLQLLNIENVVLHSDSTIALSWIKVSPHQLKTFIANRVSKIQTLTSNYQWKHIPSNNNPADLISRGVDPADIKSLELWWSGPLAIREISDSSSNPTMNSTEKELYMTEHKNLTLTTLVSSENNDFVNYILSFSNNFLKLIRILSFLFRFLYNCRNKNRQSGPVTLEEFENAKKNLIRIVQVNVFSKEINALKKKENVTGNVSNLNIFLDADNLIRVGGRIVHSDLSFDKKHPILLPKNHKLTTLILEHFHIKNLHVGAQTLLHLIRQEYWPLNGRNNARKIVHQCITCFKAKPRVEQQIMASLPMERVTATPPFTHTGIDLCGAFFIKYKNQRKGALNKIYVAVFVCFATRAVHLEILTDLTSDALIATLKRCFARRGVCTTIFSDNATNFVGASSELKKLYKLVKSNPENLASFLVSQSISWKFLPPRSPNFGGLWEAGVKSFKHHFKRTVANSRLTFEEFLTVVNQIEGILNSRPLIPLSSDPNDFETLTPGHFLIGRPISAIPEPQQISVPENRLSRWQRVQKFNQTIWKCWSRDYLNNLQQRGKWKFLKNNVQKDSLVLLKDDNLPMCSWSVGRIIDTIPGKDGNVRVVLVKTPKGIFKRGISNVCLLPVNNA